MVNRVLKFTWDEWKWLAVIVMLGVVMYWTAIVVEPTYMLVRQATETQKNTQMLIDQGITQNQRIIDTQNNNTQKITDLVNHTKVILDNQLILVHGLGNAATTITNQSQLLVAQGIDINKVLDFFRTHFNETFLEGEDNERASTKDILGNVTQIRNILLLQEVHPNQTVIDMIIEKEMRKWIQDLKDNITRQSLQP